MRGREETPACVDTHAPRVPRRRVGGVPRTATPVRLYLRSSPSVLGVLCLAGALPLGVLLLDPRVTRHKSEVFTSAAADEYAALD